MPDGSVYLITESSAQTSGEWVEMEFILPTHCVPPPPHIHPQQVEEYEVLEGSFDVMVDGDWRTLGCGESLAVPFGTVHTFRNRSGREVRVRNRHRPALRFEEYIQRVQSTLAAGGVTRRRDPRALFYLSMLLQEYPDTLVPGPRHAPVIRILARVGHLLGLHTAPR